MGRSRIAKVNIDDQQNLAAPVGARASPTFRLFKGGLVIAKIAGLKSRRDLKSNLDRGHRLSLKSIH